MELTYIQGNSFNVAIPLKFKVVAHGNNGATVVTDDYLPQEGDVLAVTLTGGKRRYRYTPTMDGSTAHFDIAGTEVAGDYALEVTLARADGRRYRYAASEVLRLLPYTGDVEATAGGDIIIGGVVLDAGVFLFAKGDKGDPFVYEDFTEEQLDDLAGRIELTPAELAEIAERVDLSGYVNGGAYDSQTKRILLTHDNVVVSSIDATAFIKDGMVSGVAVENGYIVITFNTDAGKEDIRIPVSEVFDASLYYTKTESEARFAGKPFVVTFAETAGVVVADKTFAATLAAYNGGAAVYFRFDGADIPATPMNNLGFIGVFHYIDLLLEVWLDDENKAGKNTYTLLTSGGLKTINNESLEGSGNLMLATQEALANYCPIIEDTRTSAVPNITGVAPFAELANGQMIWLHLAFDTPSSASITLTLSNGTSTGAIPFFGQTPSGGFTRISLGLYKRNHYKLCRYEADNNRWVCVNHDNDTVYYELTTEEIETGTATQTKVVSAAVLRGAFYLKSESDTRYLPQVVSVDNQSAQVEQSLESNKFYKFLNPVDELTLTLVAPTGYGDVMGIYAGKFTASSTWDSLVLPESVSIASGAPTITAGGTYEFNVCDNILMLSKI